METIKNILDKVSLIIFNKEFIELTFMKAIVIAIFIWTGIYFVFYICCLLVYLIS